MNFWKNPEYAPLKTVLAFAIVVGIGYGVYQISGNQSSLTGNVLRGTDKKTEQGVYFEITFNGESCVIRSCAVDGGKEACVNTTGQTGTFEGKEVCQVEDKLAEKIEGSKNTEEASSSTSGSTTPSSQIR